MLKASVTVLGFQDGYAAGAALVRDQREICNDIKSKEW